MSQATTPEEAVMRCPYDRPELFRADMLDTIRQIRQEHPEWVEYLTHPEIILGLAYGRYDPQALRRRIKEMFDNDNKELEP